MSRRKSAESRRAEERAAPARGHGRCTGSRAMTSRRLRKILLEAALAAVPMIGPVVPAVATTSLAVGAGGCCGSSVDENTLLVPRGDPTFAPLIDRCLADDYDCEELCVKALRDAGRVYPDPEVEYEDSYFTECRIVDVRPTEVTLETTVVTPPGGCGRRPGGMTDCAARAPTAAGAYLAACAHLEAASVHAFARLARDLAAHGAPRRLVAAALRAADDEVAHAAAVRRLAARHGAHVPALAVAPAAVASLEAVATDNAVEGGVHETWGVVVALHQARAATDPAVRAALAPIARDEADHAALAAAVDAWARPRLGAAARRRIAAARAAAVAALPAHAAATMAGIDAGGRAALGLPAPAAAAALATRLGAMLGA
jgi:hypothetical protein